MVLHFPRLNKEFRRVVNLNPSPSPSDSSLINGGPGQWDNGLMRQYNSGSPR